jgi:hypothetical protein
MHGRPPFQVFQPVVVTLTITVMNVLSLTKQSPESLLHHQPMFCADDPITSRPDVPVWKNETLTLLDVVATLTTMSLRDTSTSQCSTPLTFVAPTTLDAKIGFLVTGMAPGRYQVFAKVSSVPETPVIDCGTFWVS